MTYLLGGQVFRTKKALVDHCKELKRYVGTQYLEGTPGYMFILDLIKQGHATPEDKIRSGIRRFFIEENYHKVTRIMLERLDGSIDDFSYINCKDNLGRPRDQVASSRIREKRLAAYRASIDSQIQGFRRLLGGFTCMNCGATHPDLEYHVDHDPDFVILVHQFEKTWIGALPERFRDSVGHGYVSSVHAFIESDLAFQQAWEQYHRDYARLQILCAACNLSKPKVQYIPRDKD